MNFGQIGALALLHLIVSNIKVKLRIVCDLTLFLWEIDPASMCLIKNPLKFYTKIYFETQEIAFAAKKQKSGDGWCHPGLGLVTKMSS